MIDLDAAAPSGTVTMMFVGEGITAAGQWTVWFPEAAIVNLSVPGATVRDALDRVDEIVAAHPDEIVLLIGTNDLRSNRTVEHIVRSIQLLLVVLRRELPRARVLLQSIVPSAARFADNARQANIHLRQFAGTVGARYLDLWPALAGEDGAVCPEFSDDGVHWTEAGYQAWLAQLRPAVAELREHPPAGRAVSLAP